MKEEERKLAHRKEVTGSQPSLPGRPDNTFWTAVSQPPFPEGPQTVQYPQVRIQPIVAGDRGCLPLYKGQGGLCLPGFLLTGPELGCGRTSGRRSGMAGGRRPRDIPVSVLRGRKRGQ